MIDLFFSYAHQDEELRNELEVHLSMLKRSGLIRMWHDRRITAGNDLDREISQHLESADVILLLLSPYFLASDYCYETEAQRALELDREGRAVVIPVILQPCDWLESPFRRLRATPHDGKPVSKFPNVHDAFLQVTQDIRAAAKALGKSEELDGRERTSTPVSEPGIRSSNLRLKRSFTDRDKDAFVDETYAYVENFFENSLAELRVRNPGLEYQVKKPSASGFTAALYVAGTKRTSCHIWLPGRASFGSDIAYSASDSPTTNSMNDWLKIDDDGYQLGFKASGMSFPLSRDDKLLSPHGAAEHLWTAFVSPLQ